MYRDLLITIKSLGPAATSYVESVPSRVSDDLLEYQNISIMSVLIYYNVSSQFTNHTCVDNSVCDEVCDALGRHDPIHVLISV